MNLVPSFAQSLQRHLALYKVGRLGVKEAGVFVYRGREIKRAHILPKELKWLNLLESYRAEIQAYLSANPGVRLHKYFHHLNSSQAFALNLFYPFFEHGGTPQLLRALGVEGSVESWHPEIVPVPKEGTNVDVGWLNADGRWTYCEVKLTETEFGSAKDDDHHRKKVAETYRSALVDHCTTELLEDDSFLTNYQILRNLWLATRTADTSVLFLVPERNADLWEPLHKVLDCLQPSLRQRVHVAAIEDVLRGLVEDDSLPPRLAAHAMSLVEKYTLP